LRNLIDLLFFIHENKFGFERMNQVIVETNIRNLV